MYGIPIYFYLIAWVTIVCATLYSWLKMPDERKQDVNTRRVFWMMTAALFPLAWTAFIFVVMAAAS